MDDAWERTHPLGTVTEREANEWLRAVGRSLRVERLVPLTEGKRTTNFLVRVRGGTQAYLLRLYVPGDESWRKEAELRRRLADRVPLQPLLALGQRERPEGSQAYGIFEFVAGQSLLERIVREGRLPEPGLAHELGRILAAIHSVRYEEHGFLDERLRVCGPIAPLRDWYAMFLNERARSRLNAGLCEVVLALAETYGARLDALERDARLVHGDFRPTNLIVRDGRVAAVIDWEFALASHPAGDWGQLLRYPQLFGGAAKVAFAAGYEAGAGEPLPSDWETAGLLRDLPNLLQLLGASDAAMPRKEADLTRLIAASVDRLRRETSG